MKRNKQQKKILRSKNKIKKELSKKNAKLNLIVDFFEISDILRDIDVTLNPLRECFPLCKFEIKSNYVDQRDLLFIKNLISNKLCDFNGKKVLFKDVPYLISAYKILQHGSFENDQIKKVYESIKFSFRELNFFYYNSFMNLVFPIILSNFDYENGLFPDFSVQQNHKKIPYPLIKIEKLKLKRERLLTKNNEERLAFPCVNFNVNNFKMDFLYLDEGLIDNEKTLHVYVQDHAISRLQERIGVISNKGFLLDCLGESLANPVVVSKDGNSYLIEYRFYNYKLGYLVISNEDDFALVRSFKFITMTGTPEYRKITRALRATKYDITRMKLDDLNSFIYSDLFEDDQIEEILSNCDLGHIKEFSAKVKNIVSDFDVMKYNLSSEIKNFIEDSKT